MKPIFGSSVVADFPGDARVNWHRWQAFEQRPVVEVVGSGQKPS